MKLAEVQIGERYIVAIVRQVKHGVPPPQEKTATVTALTIGKPTPGHSRRMVAVRVERIGRNVVMDLKRTLKSEGTTCWINATELVMTEAEHATMEGAFARLRTEQRQASRQQKQIDIQRTQRLKSHGIELTHTGTRRVRYELRAPLSDLCEALRQLHPAHVPAITAIEQQLPSAAQRHSIGFYSTFRQLTRDGGPHLSTDQSYSVALMLSVTDLPLEQVNRLLTALGFAEDGTPA